MLRIKDSHHQKVVTYIWVVPCLFTVNNDSKKEWINCHKWVIYILLSCGIISVGLLRWFQTGIENLWVLSSTRNFLYCHLVHLYSSSKGRHLHNLIKNEKRLSNVLKVSQLIGGWCRMQTKTCLFPRPWYFHACADSSIKPTLPGHRWISVVETHILGC